jgi:DNA ligase (NAD+)
VSIKNLLGYVNILPATESMMQSNNRGTLLFTGGIEGLSRQEAKVIAERAGFRVASTISRNVDYLITGEKSGSKLAKAIELGVKIVNSSEFLSFINSLE